jgi:hypothetical protein
MQLDTHEEAVRFGISAILGRTNFPLWNTVCDRKSIDGIKVPWSEVSIELSHNPVICWRVVEAQMTTSNESGRARLF